MLERPDDVVVHGLVVGRTTVEVFLVRWCQYPKTYDSVTLLVPVASTPKVDLLDKPVVL